MINGTPSSKGSTTHELSAQPAYPVQSGEPALDHPWYGIGFVDAIKRGFKKYAKFEGRASRGEYWWWVLFTGVIFFVLYVAGIIIGAATIHRTARWERLRSPSSSSSACSGWR